MIKIGIVGFGVVGSGVYEVIRTNAESIAEKTQKGIDIKYILDIRDFSGHSESHLFIDSFDTMAEDDEISIIVETMGGLHPAYEFTKKALLSGKSVVTSNKELVATYGDELLALAEEKGCAYLFEASVGGGIPIIRPLNQCLAANKIDAITGILNGSTNYILTQIIKCGESFDEALAGAQKKGFAESDPTADVEGHDACRKIAILTSLMTGRKIECDKIYTRGISDITLRDVEYASKLGSVIKLIAMSRVEGEKVAVIVAPMMVSSENPLSFVEGVNNAIMVSGNAIGDAMFYGPGAGKLPTASAVVADVINIANESYGRINWTKTDEDIFTPAFSFFVRIDASVDKDYVGKIFPCAKFVEVAEGEYGFTTCKMSIDEIEEKLSSVFSKVLGIIRILD